MKEREKREKETSRRGERETEYEQENIPHFREGKRTNLPDFWTCN